MYLSILSPEEGIEFRQILDNLWGLLDYEIGDGRNPAEGSDDSHSDLCYHIIGLGKTQFYAYINDYSLIEARGKAPYGSPLGYKESFGYCVPYVNDWKIETEEENKTLRTMGFEDVIDDIRKALSEADGEHIATAYNNICSNAIKYKEDSMWEEMEKKTLDTH